MKAGLGLGGNEGLGRVVEYPPMALRRQKRSVLFTVQVMPC